MKSKSNLRFNWLELAYLSYDYLRLDRLLLFFLLFKERRCPKALLLLLFLLWRFLANAHILRHGTLNTEGPNRNHKPFCMHMHKCASNFLAIVLLANYNLIACKPGHDRKVCRRESMKRLLMLVNEQ